MSVEGPIQLSMYNENIQHTKFKNLTIKLRLDVKFCKIQTIHISPTWQKCDSNAIEIVCDVLCANVFNE